MDFLSWQRMRRHDEKFIIGLKTAWKLYQEQVGITEDIYCFRFPAGYRP